MMVRGTSKAAASHFKSTLKQDFLTAQDQFISTTATAWATIALLQSLPEKQPAEIVTLAGTKPLDWPEADLSQRLMDTAHTFIETQIEKANAARKSVRGDTKDAAARRQELAEQSWVWLKNVCRLGWSILAIRRTLRSSPRMMLISSFRSAGPCLQTSLAKAC